MLAATRGVSAGPVAATFDLELFLLHFLGEMVHVLLPEWKIC